MKKVFILLTLILSQSFIFANLSDTKEVNYSLATAEVYSAGGIDGYDPLVLEGRKMRAESIYYYEYDQINKVWSTVVNKQDPNGPPLTKQQ